MKRHTSFKKAGPPGKTLQQQESTQSFGCCTKYDTMSNLQLTSLTFNDDDEAQSINYECIKQDVINDLVARRQSYLQCNNNFQEWYNKQIEE